MNLRDLFPTRLEFNDYLTWVAGHFDERVQYGCEVVSVLPASGDGRVERQDPELLCVVARDKASGERLEFLTRHLVVAVGGEPRWPDGIDLVPGGRAFHSSGFLQRIGDYSETDHPYRFVVVGSGQSAGELFEYLIDHFPEADVTATTRRFGYKPVDESDFTNRIFFPEWIDYYHDLPDDKRRRFFNDLRDVNYAVIDHALIRRIYQKLYRQKVATKERARLRPFFELEWIEEAADIVKLGFRDLMTDARQVLEADGAVICTGYRWRKEHPLLDELAAFFVRDDLGGYRVERDYRIAAGELRPRIYLQGYCEDTHGISETVLSLLPVRAREILDSIVASTVVSRSEQPAPAVALEAG